MIDKTAQTLFEGNGGGTRGRAANGRRRSAVTRGVQGRRGGLASDAGGARRRLASRARRR